MGAYTEAWSTEAHARATGDTWTAWRAAADRLRLLSASPRADLAELVSMWMRDAEIQRHGDRLLVRVDGVRLWATPEGDRWRLYELTPDAPVLELLSAHAKGELIDRGSHTPGGAVQVLRRYVIE